VIQEQLWPICRPLGPACRWDRHKLWRKAVPSHNGRTNTVMTMCHVNILSLAQLTPRPGIQTARGCSLSRRTPENYGLATVAFDSLIPGYSGYITRRRAPHPSHPFYSLVILTPINRASDLGRRITKHEVALQSVLPVLLVWSESARPSQPEHPDQNANNDLCRRQSSAPVCESTERGHNPAHLEIAPGFYLYQQRLPSMLNRVLAPELPPDTLRTDSLAIQRCTRDSCSLLCAPCQRITLYRSGTRGVSVLGCPN